MRRLLSADSMVTIHKLAFKKRSARKHEQTGDLRQISHAKSSRTNQHQVKWSNGFLSRKRNPLASPSSLLTHSTNLPVYGFTIFTSYFPPNKTKSNVALLWRSTTMNWLQSTVASVKVYALNGNRTPQVPVPLSVNYFPHSSVSIMASVN